MQTTLLLPSLPGPLWPGVVAPNRVPSMDQIELKSVLTEVQSQVKSYQRLKKWYLMPHCLALSIIKYRSRVKWSDTGNGVVPSPTPRCSSYWKGSLRVTLDKCLRLYFIYIKKDLALSNLQWLICYKTKPNSNSNLTSEDLENVENLSLLLLQGSHWRRLIAPVRVPSMSQINV